MEQHCFQLMQLNHLQYVFEHLLIYVIADPRQLIVIVKINCGFDDEIIEACRSANVHHFIMSLPHGYDTIIDEDSDNVSAGEKQLLTIARALIANPPMIILDEATSNVDTRTEQLIQGAFTNLTKGRTSFVIAHRLSTIINSDLILVMKDGQVIEQGTHQSLLKANGFYADLYNSQLQKKK